MLGMPTKTLSTVQGMELQEKEAEKKNPTLWPLFMDGVQLPQG